MKYKIIFNEVEKQNIMVSVIIVAYKHERFLAETLRSITQQKTNFPVEVIIHDDCTPGLSMLFYQDLVSDSDVPVTVVFQSENRVSQGNGFDPLIFSKEFAKGKYVAICEGDDYWIDPCKLQKQYDVMVENPEVLGCFHPAYSEDPDGERKIIAQHKNEKYIFSTHDIIIGDGAFCPTASLFLNKSVFDRYNEKLLLSMPCGDYFTQVLSSYPNGLIFLPEVMSVYRINHPGSFTHHFSQSGYEKKIEFYSKMIKTLPLLMSSIENSHSHSFKLIERKYKKIILKFKKMSIKAKIKNLITRKI
ncbi:glycosyltransferase [Vibrio vulnificus]|uniref:glycosyltransferase family 2 protein n=1 Tax=Vibrio vulnificus TaxID=672 RepID=UPI0024DFF8DE|nr:glycosyltransferase [Vibrio vulnificus]MDK2616711.1 glycosyltransferase [Vibrio vulnificus]MDK2673871.1 glycosyltransferase [Vibrio vulnificus]